MDRYYDLSEVFCSKCCNNYIFIKMIQLRNPHIDFDKYGHCVCCHEQLITKQVIDGKLSERASPKLDEVQFLLNDSSKMRVCICRNCKHSLEESDYDSVMKVVYNGWKKQVESLN